MAGPRRCLIMMAHSSFDHQQAKKMGTITSISWDQLSEAKPGEYALFKGYDENEGSSNVILLQHDSDKVNKGRLPATNNLVNLISLTTSFLISKQLLSSTELLCAWDFNLGYSSENSSNAQLVVDTFNNNPHSPIFFSLPTAARGMTEVPAEKHPAKIVLLGAGSSTAPTPIPEGAEPQPDEHGLIELTQSQAKARYNFYSRGGVQIQLITMIKYMNPYRSVTPASTPSTPGGVAGEQKTTTGGEITPSTPSTSSTPPTPPTPQTPTNQSGGLPTFTSSLPSIQGSPSMPSSSLSASSSAMFSSSSSVTSTSSALSADTDTPMPDSVVNEQKRGYSPEIFKPKPVTPKTSPKTSPDLQTRTLNKNPNNPKPPSPRGPGGGNGGGVSSS